MMYLIYPSNENGVSRSKGSKSAPTDATEDVIAWIAVNVQGRIADEIFRTDTRGGQPPSSCTFGQTNQFRDLFSTKSFIRPTESILHLQCDSIVVRSSSVHPSSRRPLL
ncbi:hypothetical protein BXZ70DRAFT_764395 [Cristinia sonorae]|uniref:Uncharacterized protein n=1 Tax=Cristinia sonorae TaxID=1940300 RepID=A0A8K0URY7_9AGAR|nr:hypothetical protein BXZ70DRAFT_764395 [Cristinia sonorae]